MIRETIEFDGKVYECTSEPYRGILYAQTNPLREPYELKHAKPGDVGYDLPVAIRFMQNHEPGIKVSPHRDYYINFENGWIDIPPMGRAELPTGLAIKVPDDSWGMVQSRSSTGWIRNLLPFPGVLDPGYVGAIGCLIFNSTNEPIRIYDGEKLTQLILIPKYPNEEMPKKVTELPKTVRGTSCFGSSGA